MNPLKFNLDVMEDSYETCDLMQGYDYNMSFIMTDNYTNLDLTGVTIQIQMQKADHKFIIQTEKIKVAGNIINVEIDKDLTRVNGKGKLQIVLVKNGKTFGSWVIKCNIKASAINDNDGQSENKVTITETLTNKITEANNAKIELDKSIVNGDTVKMRVDIDKNIVDIKNNSAQMAEIEQNTENNFSKVENEKATKNELNIEKLRIDEIAEKGTTSEVIEQATKKEIENQIDLGTMSSLVIASATLTPDKNSYNVLEGKASINLFDKRSVIHGYYINENGIQTKIDTGNYFCTDFIKIQGNTSYAKNYPYHVAWYDDSRKFIGPITADGVLINISPVNAKYMRLTINSTNGQYTPDNCIIAKSTINLTKYTPYKVMLAVDTVEDKSLTKEKFDFNIIDTVTSVNLFNKENAQKGKYVDYTTGKILNNAYTSISERINVKANTTYTKKSNQQLAFYNSAGNYISGIQSDKTFTTPSNVSFLIMTIYNEGIASGANLETEQLEEGTKSTFYQSYGLLVDESRIRKTQKIVKLLLSKSGKGDFTEITNALNSIMDANSEKQYIIEIEPGTYNCFNGYTDEQINNTSFKGLMIKDYVSLKGIGDRNKIILQGILDEKFIYPTNMRVSPLHIESIGNIENVTIIGGNTRYALHDDYNTGNKAKRLIKNCKMIKLNGGGLAPAYGAGCLRGANIDIIDSEFHSEKGLPFSLHNNVNFSERSVWTIENCQFFNNGINIENPRYKYDIEFPSEGSKTEDEINLIGNYMPNGFNAYVDTESGLNTGNIFDYVIKGYGNSKADNKYPSDAKCYLI